MVRFTIGQPSYPSGEVGNSVADLSGAKWLPSLLKRERNSTAILKLEGIFSRRPFEKQNCRTHLDIQNPFVDGECRKPSEEVLSAHTCKDCPCKKITFTVFRDKLTQPICLGTLMGLQNGRRYSFFTKYSLWSEERRPWFETGHQHFLAINQRRNALARLSSRISMVARRFDSTSILRHSEKTKSASRSRNITQNLRRSSWTIDAWKRSECKKCWDPQSICGDGSYKNKSVEQSIEQKQQEHREQMNGLAIQEAKALERLEEMVTTVHADDSAPRPMSR